MVDFCPECSNLLRRQSMNGEIYLICRCGYQRKIEDSDDDLEIDLIRKKKALEKNLVILSDIDKIVVNPIIDKYCPKCGKIITHTP